ncbi:sigma-70 family RNA polymerase sigma factor [Amycolatopsis endophytica]|uniref:RNA polymerase sigma factor (Sigma-70 family) n=1 Tax=Amycolatopsis endophytica TaxID=860233 RepID=A0A853AZT1_9PSEU|nr:sigma-70 family RNA polymerase sigma factor [Amycolatopsis endophytica]NYI88061.1 RNA polymerase sigma factor (sigma-70 family) [Amycolatopsis endophytica]
MTDFELIDLLARAWRGDESAWCALVRGLSVVALRVARAHHLGEADASDVCQNTWVSLAQLRTLREPSRLPAWLATTARRQVLRMLESRRREIPADCEAPDERTVPERLVLTAERDALVHRAVAELPGVQRNLVEMLLHDPPASHAEIAAALGISVGSVGPIRRRALDRMRRYLEARGYDHA